MKIFGFLIVIFLTICKTVSCQETIKGDYYRYDTLEIFKKVPYDSIRFDLHYVEIGNDSVWYAIIPMYSNQPKYFSFLPDSNRFSYTRINKTDSGILININYTDNFSGDIAKSTILYEKKQIKIDYLNDSTLIVDDKQFKVDKGLKIFQSFTGY